MTDGSVYLTVSTDKDASVRDALRNPTFNIKTNIFDKKLDDILYFDYNILHLQCHFKRVFCRV